MDISTMDVSSLKTLQTGIAKVIDQSKSESGSVLNPEEEEAFDKFLKLVDSAISSPTPDQNTSSDSLEQKVDNIISLLNSTQNSTQENNTPSRQPSQYIGVGPNGEEVKGEDLIREGGEIGSEKDTEQARKHVGEAVDPSPEPEGTTRLRKMIIRIQTQNNITHGMLAFSLIFSMAWRFGTFAFVNSISSNITRPFDVAGNCFNTVLGKGGKKKEGISLDTPFEEIRNVIPGVKSGENDGKK